MTPNLKDRNNSLVRFNIETYFYYVLKANNLTGFKRSDLNKIWVHWDVLIHDFFLQGTLNVQGRTHTWFTLGLHTLTRLVTSEQEGWVLNVWILKKES